MSQRWSMIESNTADIPTGAVTSYYKGVNAPGGPEQSVLFHLTTVTSGQIAATDVSTLLTEMASYYQWRRSS